MPTMEMKTFSVEVSPKAEGRFKALICTFGKVDKGNDTVVRGAFEKSLARWRASNRSIPVVYNHQADDPTSIIGNVSPHDTQEGPVGLTVLGALYLDEDRALKVYSELRRGTLAEWSFGALVKDSRPGPDGSRLLTELDLVEVSPVLLGKGDTATLMVASAAAASSAPRSSLTVDEQLKPYRARLAVAQQRVARRR